MLRLHVFSNGMSILMCIKRLCGNFQYVMTKQKQFWSYALTHTFKSQRLKLYISWKRSCLSSCPNELSKQKRGKTERGNIITWELRFRRQERLLFTHSSQDADDETTVHQTTYL